MTDEILNNIKNFECVLLNCRIGATCIVQPLDLVKTRLQVQSKTSATAVKEYKNSFHCIQVILNKEGPLAFYTGIGAALLRQATYTTGRLGVYTLLNDYYKE